jgi:hypothetical protein
MVLYARSDVIRESATEPPGGCGYPHERPLIDSKNPDKGYVAVWGIDCPPCEARLHDDVRWSKTRHRIPLTPDEQLEMQEAKEAAQAMIQQQQILLAQAAQAEAQRARVTSPQGDDTDAVITKSGASPVAPVNEEAPSGGADYSALRVSDLKDMARERGLGVGGTKEDLIARHLEYDAG